MLWVIIVKSTSSTHLAIYAKLYLFINKHEASILQGSFLYKTQTTTVSCEGSLF